MPETSLSSELWSPERIAHAEGVPHAIRTVMDWVSQYVMRPHSELGRTGVVCPFVPTAVDRQTLWLALVAETYTSEEGICPILLHFMDLYQSLEPRRNPAKEFKTLILVFSGIGEDDAVTLVPRVHKAMKPRIVEAGLMLGEFYAASDSPGLHNSHFRPLRSPVPLFVYRQLVANDLGFLTKPADPPQDRVRFVEAYLRVLDGQLSAERVRQAHDALAIARRELLCA